MTLIKHTLDVLLIHCSADSEDVKFTTVDLNSSSSWFMSLDADCAGIVQSHCLAVCM